LGNNQYPKTITTAIDVLSNHKLDPRYYDNQKRNRERSREERNTNDEGGNATSFAQHDQVMTCYCCGKKGHLSPECDTRNSLPREQWHVDKAMQHQQEGDDADDKYTEELTDDEELLTIRSTSSQNYRSGTTLRNRNMEWFSIPTGKLHYTQQ
jgi:hypothetical protein